MKEILIELKSFLRKSYLYSDTKQISLNINNLEKETLQLFYIEKKCIKAHHHYINFHTH